MHFVYPLPWWLGVLLAAAIGSVAVVEYRRPLAPLTAPQRAALVSFRVLVLAALVLFLFRPVVLVTPLGARDAIVPVLIDASRSMRLNDADGRTRIARAAALVKEQLLPALTRQSSPQLFSVGERLEPTTLDSLKADQRRSDLSRALSGIRDRYRGQRVAGIVLVSDGGDTSRPAGETAEGPSLASDPTETDLPVFAIGVGSSQGLRDRQIAGITAGEQRLDQASVDLRVTALSSGFGRAPFAIRLAGNGHDLETRRVVPPADGAPIDEAFTVSPDAANPTVYTAEIAADAGEAVVENNSRSVLVNPAGPKRRLLIVEGAPGFEHSFLKRAWLRDPSLEVDAVGRKGKNGEGQDTLFVQAAAVRTSALAHGLPSRREDLFAYDGIVLANVEGDFFTRAQLTTLADFVGERGGGLLLIGGRSLTTRGLEGTALEHVLPVELSDRRGGLVRTAAPLTTGSHNKVVVTPEGENHPVMRIGGSPEDSRRLWLAFPPLASSAPVGAARPGATVLAVAASPAGAVYPVVAVQRYGRGRSMVFTGEASWRWKMMLPATDRSYEFFWRQAARWIAGSAPDRVTVTGPDTTDAGDEALIDIDVRDAAFLPVGDGSVEAAVMTPGGDTRAIKLRRSGATGHYLANVPMDQPGLYRVTVSAQRGSAPLGSATRWLYAGGFDREFADPRLNEAWLRRVARASGGRYVNAADASRVAGWLQETSPQQPAPERRDLWHEPWTFGAIALLLSAEWMFRRRWGLR